MQGILDKAERIRLIVFDVDGVLTDGRLYLSDSGEEFKAFCSLDGHGMKMLKAAGVELAIITGRTSRCVELRAHNLGVRRLYQGAENKLTAYLKMLEETGLAPEQTAFMGDDVVDLPAMRRCGLSFTVPDAPEIVKLHADHVTALGGGRGAVREACEIILRAQGAYDAQMALYLE